MKHFVWIISAALACGQQIAEQKTLTLDGARRIISGGTAEATRRHTTGAFAVVDRGGHLLALERTEGTFAAAAEIATGKADTALRFEHPTQAFEDSINKGRTAMAALNNFTPLQGGVPVFVDGKIVGAVGVSGAASAAEDQELAVAAAQALEHTSPVTYFESHAVNSAFAKGSVLFDQGERYMVHASRREAPGMAEVHTDDADIVHVLEGTATLITGGKAIDLKMTGAGEFRGSAIEGGEARMLKKGDVIIIPAGVPHWFKEVSNPLLYYVVKSR
jgi:glc operon protein GlcG